MPAVLQRGPNLPPASGARGRRVCWPLDGPCRQVTLLSDYRRDLVKHRKRVVNRLRWHLRELDPTLPIPPRGLRRYCVIDALTERRDAREGAQHQRSERLVTDRGEAQRVVKRGERAPEERPRPGRPNLQHDRADEVEGVWRHRANNPGR
jgi:hypothetical protein